MTEEEYQTGIAKLRAEWGGVGVQSGLIIAVNDPTTGLLAGVRAPIIAEILNRALEANTREARLEAALRQCAAQFTFYETEHLRKGTPDGDAKAYRNKQFADICNAALEGTCAAPTADIREVYEWILSGEFYSDYDRASRLTGVLCRYVEALEGKTS